MLKQILPYYGFGFIIYAIFNFIFLTEFFKTAHQVGEAFLMAIIPVAIGVLIMEVIVHFPGFKWLDSVEPNYDFETTSDTGDWNNNYALSMLAAFKRYQQRGSQKVDLSNPNKTWFIKNGGDFQLLANYSSYIKYFSS